MRPASCKASNSSNQTRQFASCTSLGSLGTGIKAWSACDWLSSFAPPSLQSLPSSREELIKVIKEDVNLHYHVTMFLFSFIEEQQQRISFGVRRSRVTKIPTASVDGSWGGKSTWFETMFTFTPSIAANPEGPNCWIIGSDVISTSLEIHLKTKLMLTYCQAFC